MGWYRRIRNVLSARRLQRDLDRELSFHIAERADEFQADGATRDEALLRARRQFGNLTSQTERTRDMDIAAWLDLFLRNLRHSARALLKTPAFAITVTLTLALGIGANSAVFSAIHAVLLRPLPFPEGDQLMQLQQTDRKNPPTPVGPVRLTDWDRLNSTFQGITGYYTQDDSELSAELPERLKRALVAPRFLQVWGMSPALGRDFNPAEEHFGGPNAVLISDRFWRRRFNADPNTPGKQLRIGTQSVTIIGVMPPSFLFPDRDVDLWSPSPMDAPFGQRRDLTWFRAIGRLKPGVTLEQARANLGSVQMNLGKQFPDTDAKIFPDIQPLKEVTVGGIRQSLWVLFGSVSLLLLIACTNIAALLLSRAAHRRHEIAVRFSLGASRASVIAQLLTEVALLSVAGAALGLLLASASSRVFRVLAADLPRVDELGLDWRIVLYTLIVAIAATFLCGLFPALRASRTTLNGSLRASGRGQVGGRNPVQLTLVGVQVALAVTLLVGAALLARSLEALGRVSPGFDASHVLTLRISANWGETADPKVAKQRSDRIMQFLTSTPGVEAASIAFTVPGTPNQFQTEVQVSGGRTEADPKILVESRYVSPGYFATMRIPMLSGELCTANQPVPGVMVNRSFADRYLNGAAGLGRQISQPGNSYATPTTILGIVGDAREAGLDHAPAPTVYWCYGSMQPNMVFLVRTFGDPASMISTLRRGLRPIEPRRSIYGAAPLEEQISSAFAENRLRTYLLGFFAITAILLACVGLYGTLSYLVSVRQREVGLRLALGAMRGQIIRQFLTQGLAVSIAGCAVGVALATLSTRLLAGMLFGVSPWDPATLVSVIAMVLGVAAIASLAPALRAARLDPMQVLRNE